MTGLFYVSYVALWVVVLVQGVLLLLVYRHFGIMLMGKFEGLQRDGRSIGESAIPFASISPTGEKVEWTPKVGRPELLAFVSVDCGPCLEILPSIVALEQTSPGLSITLVSPGGAGAVSRLVEEVKPSDAITCVADSEGNVQELYGVRATPFLFLIDPEGKIQSKGLCTTKEKLDDVLLPYREDLDAVATTPQLIQVTRPQQPESNHS